MDDFSELVTSALNESIAGDYRRFLRVLGGKQIHAAAIASIDVKTFRKLCYGNSRSKIDHHAKYLHKLAKASVICDLMGLRSTELNESTVVPKEIEDYAEQQAQMVTIELIETAFKKTKLSLLKKIDIR